MSFKEKQIFSKAATMPCISFLYFQFPTTSKNKIKL